jgi:hypothetical protein
MADLIKLEGKDDTRLRRSLEKSLSCSPRTLQVSRIIGICDTFVHMSRSLEISRFTLGICSGKDESEVVEIASKINSFETMMFVYKSPSINNALYISGRIFKQFLKSEKRKVDVYGIDGTVHGIFVAMKQ